MNDIVTIRGNVGNDPVRATLPSGDSVLNFRVATSHGYRDRRTGTWVETGTNWFAVSAFRRLADNAKASLRSGDAVIITGRLQLKEWHNNGRSGFSADIVADAIGHDLDRGTSNFLRTPRPTSANAPAGPAADAPDTDEADQPVGASTGSGEDWSASGLYNVDGTTGEVQEKQEEDAYANA